VLDLETSVLSPARQASVDFLRRFILAIRDGVCRRAATRTAVWAAAALVAALAAAVLADAAIHLATSTRLIVYPAILLAGAAVGGGAVLRAWRRKPAALFIARVIERRRGELKNSLITFLELQADPLEDPNTAAAVGLRAARLLAETDPRVFLPPRRLRRPGMALAGAVLLLGVAMWLGQGVLFDPWTGAAEASITPPSFGGSEKPGQLASARNPEPLGQGGSNAANATGGGTGAASKSPGPAGGGSTGSAGEGAGSSPQAVASAVQADAAKFQRLAQALGQAAPGEGSDAGSAGGANPSSNQDAGTGSTPPSPESRGGDTAPGGTPDVKPGPGHGESPENKGSGEGIGGATNPPPGHSTQDVIPERPQPQGFPQEALDSIKAAKRIIDQADRRLREGEASDTFLGEIGMSREEFRRFVVGWQRKLETAAGGVNVSAVPAVQTVVGGAQGEALRPGGGVAGQAVRGTEAAGKDATELFTQAESGVSGRLQPAVSAYFEAVERAAAQAKDGKQ